MMDGALIIDKPAGLTSHDVVARVRRILRERRVGHTGTLDPFATGVLVVLVGRATRLAQFLSGAEKEYEAVIRFGYRTTTGDVTGEPVPPLREDVDEALKTRTGWDAREIESALASLRGEIEQVPPMYSAKKIEGRKLYELARRGEEVERQAVRVNIYELEALGQHGLDQKTLDRKIVDQKNLAQQTLAQQSLDQQELDQQNAARQKLAQQMQPAWPPSHQEGTRDLTVRVVCSAGTYIRTLAEAVGERLGTGAHLAALRRTRAGQFKLEEAVTLDELSEQAEAGDAVPQHLLRSPDAALSALPFVHLSGEEARRVRHGMSVPLSVETAEGWRDGEAVRLRDEQGELLAVGAYEAATRSLRPRVVLSPAE